MAKFKKKKSDPTPDPEDSKKVSTKDDNNEIPETESTEFKPKTPVEASANQDEKSEKDKKLNKLFWLRICFAVFAGTLATFIFEDIEGEERRWASIAFMIIVFIATIFIAKGMKMQLPSSDRKKIVTQGIGSYIFIYLFVWILTYTIMHAGTISTGIPSPLS